MKAKLMKLLLSGSQVMLALMLVTASSEACYCLLYQPEEPAGVKNFSLKKNER